MPARSEKQRRLFALAEHHPEDLYPQNRDLAKLPHQTLHDFASTPERKLPKVKMRAIGQMARRVSRGG